VIRFYQERFLEAFNSLRQVESELELILADSSGKQVEAFPHSVHVQRTQFALRLIETQCGTLELRDQGQMAKQISRGLHADSKFFAPTSVKEMLAELKMLRDSIQSKLGQRLFMYVPTAKAEYWQMSGPFPRSRLPQAVKDTQWEIDEAGNCYAGGRNTACVFHLMRAAEHGLRMLARRLRVKLTHKGKAMPIEFGDWNAVIVGIKNKICQMRKLSAGPKRQAKLEVYSSAADHCEYMKEIWRNNLAHARRPYNDLEAAGALARVLDFMQFIGNALTSRSF
jgi:hypothetical protein